MNLRRRHASALLCASLPLGPWALSTALAAPPASAFDLQGHRGTRGLAPENTLAAFRKALALGVTTLELDIAITADGVPVISHEPAIFEGFARDASGQWLTARGPLIHTLTLAQVQAYDIGRLNPNHAYGKTLTRQVPADGERIPTLAALFQMTRQLGADQVRFNIETKVFPKRPDDTAPPQVFVDTLLALFRQAGMVQRVALQSFDWRTLRLMQKAEPAIPTVYLTIQRPGTNNTTDPAWTDGLQLADYPSVPHMVKAAGGAAWSPLYVDLTADAVATAHSLGLKVLPWTVNEPADIDRLIDWGVDGLISDYPDRLREAAGKRGLALPAPLARP